MAAGDRRNLPDVIHEILESVSSYDFTQAAHIIEQHWSERGKIGGGLDKLCRFRPASETSFPAADIRRCQYDDNGRLEFQLNFMGFYGVDAVVPQYFSDHALQNDNGAKALRAFLDIFNHRVYALYYQAWKKYRPAFYLNEPSNLHLKMISAISGWSVNTNHRTALSYAGLLGSRFRSAEGLKGLLSDYLESMQVMINQFQPRWISIKTKLKLGVNELRLGDDFVLGDKVLDISGKIDINIGPISPLKSMQLMPDSERGSALMDLVRRYLPPCVDFDLVIHIASGSVASIPLGSDQLALGWSTWLQNSVTADWEVRVKGI